MIRHREMARLALWGSRMASRTVRIWNTVLPGTFFVPTVNNSMPEMWHYGYKTEFITRDLQPFPGVMKITIGLERRILAVRRRFG